MQVSEYYLIIVLHFYIPGFWNNKVTTVFPFVTMHKMVVDLQMVNNATDLSFAFL